MKKVLQYLCVCTLTLMCSYPTQVHAEHYKAKQTFTPTITTSSGPNVVYGITVRKNNNFIFVAAPGTFNSAGAVYVYKKSGSSFKQTQILTTQVSNILGAFQIESQRDWLIVSCVGTSGMFALDLKGSVQIYRFDSKTDQWVLKQTLNRLTPGLENLTMVDPGDAFLPISTQFEHGANFGLTFSLDLKHGRLLVGAQNQQNKDQINSGAVYAFELNRKTELWELVQTITNPRVGALKNDNFGCNVAIHGDLAIIGTGAVLTIPKVIDGSVYVFQHIDGKWRYVQRVKRHQIHAKDISVMTLAQTALYTAGDGFGASLALSNEFALVGAPTRNRSADVPYAGAVYFYRIHKKENGKKELRFEKKVFSDDPASRLMGLLHLELRGNTALIPDPGRTGPNGLFQGGIIVYRHKDGKWRQTNVIYDPNGAAYEVFGEGVSLTENYIVGGTDPTVFPVIYSNLGLSPDPLPALVNPGKAVLFKRVGPR